MISPTAKDFEARALVRWQLSKLNGCRMDDPWVEMGCAAVRGRRRTEHRPSWTNEIGDEGRALRAHLHGGSGADR